MRKLTIRLNDEEFSELEELKVEMKAKTINSAVKNAVIIAKNAVTQNPSRARHYNIYNKYIYEKSDDFRSNGLSLDKKITQKKPPPQHLPEDWEPPKHLRHEYCEKYDLEYRQALELFRELQKQDQRKSGNWDATWSINVKKGVLRQMQATDDFIKPSDTLAEQLGNAGTLDYLMR